MTMAWAITYVAVATLATSIIRLIDRLEGNE